MTEVEQLRAALIIFIVVAFVAVLIMGRLLQRADDSLDAAYETSGELITALHELLTDPRPETIQRAKDVLERRAMVIGWGWKK